MLFKTDILNRIASGELDLAFRRWRRPPPRPGSLIRTPAGVLVVNDVAAISEGEITDQEAGRAGYASRDAALDELARYPAGTLYRVELSLAGPDPREALREDDSLSGTALTALRQRLGPLDRASRRGPWTAATLRAIGEYPAERAAVLASHLGVETAPLKLNVRKLKELGLTESVSTGYRLSPRGLAFIASDGTE